jgi:hypothetical protein
VLTTLGGLTGLIIVIAGIASASGKARQADSASTAATSTPARTATPSAAPTHQARSTSTTARKPSFPPETLAAFRAFAATGDASEVHQVANNTVGLASCPDPAIYVTVSPGLTVREVEADLSAFFVQSGLLSNQCQPVVWAYHSRSDYEANNGNGYTAGRVIITTNTGPGPQHNLEVDAGAADDFPAQFDFNF